MNFAGVGFAGGRLLLAGVLLVACSSGTLTSDSGATDGRDAAGAMDRADAPLEADGAPCVGQGEIETTTPFPNCCPGLRAVHVGSEDAGVCTGSDAYACIRCGDGTCERWEDRCNCSADCGGI